MLGDGLGHGRLGHGRLGHAASGLRLVIAGGETLFDYRDYRARWDKRAAELGVAPVVLGPVDHDELPALVAAAAVFAFPSAKEGFGLAAMEALAAGVPVVTRELPVLREVFGAAARFAADPAGLAVQLRAALDDPGSLRAAGQALAESYTWEAAATAHLKLYRSLLDRAAPLANAVPRAGLAGPGAKDGPNGPRENITLTPGLPESSSRGWYVQGRRKDAGRG
jgi:glycosyltransferase involved in cell wall biosynthesis